VLGYRAIFLIQAVAAGALWPLIRRLPSVSSSPASTNAPRAAAPATVRGILLPIAVFASQIGQGCFWTFVPLAGAQADLGPGEIDMVLSLSTLALLIGPVAAGLLATRLGHSLPLVGGMLVNTAAMALAFTSKGLPVFLAANLVQAGTNLFAVVYQIGLTARADGRGRIAATAASAVLLGNGLAPAFAGEIVDCAGLSTLLASIVAFNLLALLLYGIYGARAKGSGRP